MILLANGCSWTYGGGLGLDQPDRRTELDQLTWPKHLSDLMGADRFVNLAQGCGSNQYIFRSTLAWLLTQTEKTLRDTVAVIQWTEGSRYEYYVPTSFNVPYENLNDNWVKVKFGVQLPRDSNFRLSQDRLKYHHSDIQDLYMFISWCESLSSLLNRFGIKYYFWAKDKGCIPTSVPQPYQDYMLSNYTWASYKDNIWQHWEYERVSEEDSHPGLTGHKQLAQYFYEVIQND